MMEHHAKPYNRLVPPNALFVGAGSREAGRGRPLFGAGRPGPGTALGMEDAGGLSPDTGSFAEESALRAGIAPAAGRCRRLAGAESAGFAPVTGLVWAAASGAGVRFGTAAGFAEAGALTALVGRVGAAGAGRLPAVGRCTPRTGGLDAGAGGGAMDAPERRRAGALREVGMAGRGKSETEPVLDVGRELEMEERREPAEVAEPWLELVEDDVRSCCATQVILGSPGAGICVAGSVGLVSGFGAAVGALFSGPAGGRLNTGALVGAGAARLRVCSMEGAGLGGVSSFILGIGMSTTM